MCSGGAWTNWYKLACTKGELKSETSACTQGEHGQQNVYQRREYLGPPFALDVKRGE